MLVFPPSPPLLGPRAELLPAQAVTPPREAPASHLNHTYHRQPKHRTSSTTELGRIASRLIVQMLAPTN